MQARNTYCVRLMLVSLLCTDDGVYDYEKLNRNMAALSAAGEKVCPHTASILAIGEAYHTGALASIVCKVVRLP